jgi:fibro-slime domain-containing protein
MSRVHPRCLARVLLCTAALAAAACTAPRRDPLGDDDALDPDAGGADAVDAGAGFIDAVPEMPHGGGDAGDDHCGELTAVLRDFKEDFVDFEGSGLGDDRGLVRDDLGADGKPVFAPAGATATASGAASFDRWYRDVPGVNLHFEQPLALVESAPGVFVFDDAEFFPLDGMGWPGEEIIGHNFHFTTEIHGTFLYRGGEHFTFRGDDDVFVFVNGKLALDLGGVHGPEESTIDFDAAAAHLGITPGQTCALDVFHAERHTSQSTFRIETSIDCLVVVQ